MLSQWNNISAFFWKQLRRIRAVADWLDDKKANRDIHELREKYEPQLTEAEKTKNREERETLMSQWGFERDLVLDPVHARKAERLFAKARRCGITLPPQPSSYEAESEAWWLSNVVGWLPSDELEQRLRREIRDEKRASYDESRKTLTLAFAIIGTILVFISIRTKQKQPDPCPRNYYRNDSGECVFALQKNSRQALGQASPSQTAPSPRTAEKPSPGRKSPVPSQ